MRHYYCIWEGKRILSLLISKQYITVHCRSSIETFLQRKWPAKRILNPKITFYNSDRTNKKLLKPSLFQSNLNSLFFPKGIKSNRFSNKCHKPFHSSLALSQIHDISMLCELNYYFQFCTVIRVPYHYFFLVQAIYTSTFTLFLCAVSYLKYCIN